MSMESIIEILKIVGYIILGGAALYFKANSALKEKAASVIAEAEEAYKDTTKAGGIKFEFAVDKLHGALPVWIKPFISRDVVGQVVQTVFDGVESYGKTQLDKLTKSIYVKRELQ